jgi:hypothetical protein
MYEGNPQGGPAIIEIEIAIEIGKLPGVDFDHNFDFDFDSDSELPRFKNKLALARVGCNIASALSLHYIDSHDRDQQNPRYVLPENHEPQESRRRLPDQLPSGQGLEVCPVGHAGHLIALLAHFQYYYLEKVNRSKYMVTAEQICREANRLPQNVLPTVLDFMLFLQKRTTENQENDLVMAQESSTTALWDNEEDEAWNEVPIR